MNTPLKPKVGATEHKLVLDLGGKEEPVQISSSAWKGIQYVGIRQTFRSNGTLYFGKQGFNIPLVDFEEVLVALITCYNAATGVELTLLGPDEDRLNDLFEEMGGRLDQPSELVSLWGK